MKDDNIFVVIQLIENTFVSGKIIEEKDEGITLEISSRYIFVPKNNNVIAMFYVSEQVAGTVEGLMNGDLDYTPDVAKEVRRVISRG